MRNTQVNRLLCAGFVMMLFTAVSVWAQPSDDNPGRMQRHENKMEKIIQELNLTPQQQEQIKQLRAQREGQAKSLRDGLRSARQSLKAELDRQNIDEAKVKTIAQELKQLEGQMIDMRISRVLEMKKVLTPEQYQILQEKIKQNMHQRRGERLQPR